MSLLLCLCITQDFYHLGYKQLVPQRSINSRSQHSSWGSAIAQPKPLPQGHPYGIHNQDLSHLHFTYITRISNQPPNQILIRVGFVAALIT